MKNLLKAIEELKLDNISKLISKRIKEFEGLKSKDLFDELCFCLLTANYNAEKSINIQNKLKNGFSCFSEKKLAEKLRELGHRFPNARADYIVKARKFKKELRDNIDSMNESEVREWIVNNIKGLGYKEASHFLRNIGFKNLAIIDFHIIDLLVKNGVIEKPRTLTKKEYLRIENILRKIGEKANLNLAELDLYLWYLETGKVLK